MLIPFTKMQAQGNDFIIIPSNLAYLKKETYSQLACQICNRHYGIGADGLVLFDLHKIEFPRMKIFNADGSEAKNCGSALRCCAVLYHQRHNFEHVRIINDSGTHQCLIKQTNPYIVTVSMNVPKLIEAEKKVKGFTGKYISVGNPHYVILNKSFDDELIKLSASQISTDTTFEEGTNVEFVSIISQNEIKIIIYERGVGFTLACGTGATASVFALHQDNILNMKVKVEMPGGSVTIEKSEYGYLLSGEVVTIAKGEYHWIA